MCNEAAMERVVDADLLPAGQEAEDPRIPTPMVGHIINQIMKDAKSLPAGQEPEDPRVPTPMVGHIINQIMNRVNYNWSASWENWK